MEYRQKQVIAKQPFLTGAHIYEPAGFKDKMCRIFCTLGSAKNLLSKLLSVEQIF